MSRVAKILTRVRDSLADPDADRWSNARLIRLFNEAMDVPRLSWLRRWFTTVRV